ncbi:MAG TPA: FkbM family methyltransferase [Isosphaeraceae bacterium]|nr:FkbM family methyltransferase [Isosphaeraceae bacterium]
MQKRWSWVRCANIALAIVAAILLVYRGGWIYREVLFRIAGRATVDGLTIYLDPRDEVITPAILVYGEWEIGESAEMRRLIRPGDTVVDVGANVGWYTLLASSRVGDSGRVIAFEPAQGSLSLLRKSITANYRSNVSVEPKALSDRRGSITLHIHETNRGGHSILEDAGRTASVEVETVTLDEYLGGRESEIGLVKIDVEGAEGLVLAGMRETLRKRLPRTVIVEFNPSAVRRTGLDPEDVLRRVLEPGYRVRTLEVWSGRSTTMDETGAIDLLKRMEADATWTDLVFERNDDGR